jgi:hypothetical protein
MMETGALGPQKSVRQNPATQILFELFDHKIWKWVPQVLFDLALERDPIGLNQFVERGLFWFVALVMVGLGIEYRHRQIWCLQRPWPVRMALLTAALARWSGITTWMSERPRRGQMHEPFGHGHLRRPERLFANDRLLPFIHSFAEQLLNTFKLILGPVSNSASAW